MSKNKQSISKPNGFSLIEMLIAIVIVALLTAIALPSYNASVRNSNRADARADLMLYQTRLERCFSLNRTYVHSANTPCGASQALATGGTESGERLYRIEFAEDPAAASFLLRAAAIKSPQLEDSGCTQLTLDHIGNALPENCW